MFPTDAHEWGKAKKEFPQLDNIKSAQQELETKSIDQQRTDLLPARGPAQ